MHGPYMARDGAPQDIESSPVWEGGCKKQLMTTGGEGVELLGERGGSLNHLKLSKEDQAFSGASSPPPSGVG